MNIRKALSLSSLAGLAVLAPPLAAHDINSPVEAGKAPAFDITLASAETDGRLTTFMMQVAGAAGTEIPESIGQLEGSRANAYVWPTDLDPSVVGFDPGSGILALAVTAHPDFDDTPLFDENNDGDPANDGKTWHSHWVVLVDESSCAGNLTVRDITPGRDLLPATAPGLPIALDSPGMSPIMNDGTTRLTVPLADSASAAFDAVTSVLQVNTDGEAPLLCVTDVHDVASGDLSLSGIIMARDN